jgi:hypothetical protein
MILDALGRLVIWGFRKVGGRALIYLFFLVIIFGDIVIGLNASLIELKNLDFYRIVLAALLVGWWLAHSKLAGWQAAVVMTGLGLTLIAISAGGLGNPFYAIARAFLGYSWAAIHWHTGEPLPDAKLVLQLAGELGRTAQITEPVMLIAGDDAVSPLSKSRRTSNNVPNNAGLYISASLRIFR